MRTAGFVKRAADHRILTAAGAVFLAGGAAGQTPADTGPASVDLSTVVRDFTSS